MHIRIDFPFLGLQSFSRECEDKDMAAMLEDITKQANVNNFVNVLQHGAKGREEAEGYWGGEGRGLG
jgi:hypothetical protein